MHVVYHKLQAIYDTSFFGKSRKTDSANSLEESRTISAAFMITSKLYYNL